MAMAEGYWITLYGTVSNPAAIAQYAKLAELAIQIAGGRFLDPGIPFKAFEAANERFVVIEFESLQRALAAYESPAYRDALKLPQGAAERAVRMLEGIPQA